jgi:hypothetical protein
VEDAAAAKAQLKCHKSITTAARVLAGKRLKALDVCASAVLKCVQTKPGDLTCITKAEDKCAGQLAKIAKAEAKFADKVESKCGETVPPADLLSPNGLDYGSLAAECNSRFLVDPVDAASIGECIARQHACQDERLLETENPRVAELLRLAGASPGAGSCLVLDDTDKGDVGNVDLGKRVEACVTGVQKAAVKFVDAKLKGIHKCATAIFTCIKAKPGDNGCLTKADGTCQKALQKIDAVDAIKLTAAIDKKCTVAFATLKNSNGANIDALAADCAAHGIASLDTLANYETCLFLQHTCRAEELLRFEMARANALITSRGLPSQESAFCPPPSP